MLPKVTFEVACYLIYLETGVIATLVHGIMNKEVNNMKESTFQEKCIKLLRKKGAYVENISGGSIYQASGISDLIACYKGVYLGLELKTGDYKPTELQKSKLNNVIRAGGVGQVIIHDPKRKLDGFKTLSSFLLYIDINGKAPKQELHKLEGNVVFDD